jgi:hypothetical protein
VQIFDEHGVDVLQGLGMNVDQAAPTSAPIVYASTNLHPAVNEDSVLRLKVGQQFNPSAQITVTVYYALGY